MFDCPYRVLTSTIINDENINICRHADNKTHHPRICNKEHCPIKEGLK